MDIICRLCSLKTPHLSSIYSFLNDRLISDMIILICPIKVDPLDNYPKNICKGCLHIISEAYELREKSVYSDIQFRTQEFKTKAQDKATIVTRQHPEVTKVQKEAEPRPKMPEPVSIKQEHDPFSGTIEFVDENNQFEDEMLDVEHSEDDEDYDEDFCEEITPVTPSTKKLKYEKIKVDDVTKFKCTLCNKAFSLQINVKQHMIQDHFNNRPPLKREIVSATCDICGAFISHKQNLKRHIKYHHPDFISTVPEERPDTFQELFENSSELTRRFFDTPKKAKYMEYITIVAIENGNLLKYQCLLCQKNPNKADKVWSQSTKNGGTSNIRRHLCTTHPEEFKKLEGDPSNFGVHL